MGRACLVGGVTGCQVSNFSTAVCLVQLFARRIVIVVFNQRDIATAYDEGHADFIVGEILGALKKGSDSNHHHLRRSPLGLIMLATPGSCSSQSSVLH